MIKLPEPAWRAATIRTTEDGYTADQLKQAILDALEEAAKLCESQWSNVAEKLYGVECATAIRKLKEDIQ